MPEQVEADIPAEEMPRDLQARMDTLKFVREYSHEKATAADRERYLTAVRELYPRVQTPEAAAQNKFELKCVAVGGLGLIMGLIAFAVWGWLCLDEWLEGVFIYLNLLAVVIAAIPVVGIFVFFLWWSISTLFFW